jgi:dihydropyrimidinase
MKLAQNKAVTDYSFHVGVTEFNSLVSKELSSIISKGITSFKLFTIYEHMMLSDSEIYGMLQAAAEKGLLCSFHCENSDLTENMKARFKKQNTLSAPYHAFSRPDFHEAEAVGRVIDLARATDSSIYIVHLSSAAGLEKVTAGQMLGVNVMAETCPQYLFLDDTLYSDDLGYQFLCSPPLRKPKDQQALFTGIKEGTISVVATDHCPFKKSQKEPFKDSFIDVPMGLPGVETLVPLMITKSLESPDILDICDVSRLTSTAPAKIFGMYPEKGCLYPGSDADIIVIDLEKTSKISASSLHMNIDLSPYEGRSLTGFPEMVISRGEIVLENYTLKAKKGRGQFIKRTPVF